MTLSPVDFATDLYQEHLEETSFLYEQRIAMLDDPEITWVDLKEFEARFDAHIDAMVVGGALATEVCKEQAAKGDFGELHAAVRVFCRQDRKELVVGVLEDLDPKDAESMQAFSDALKYEFPEDWHDDFFQMLPEDDQKTMPVLADLFGCRRMKQGVALLRVLADIPAGSLSKVIWSLGRLGDESARAPLFKYLQHEDESIRAATALALLRLGEQQTMQNCLQEVPVKSWAFIPLGLGGSRSAVNVLLEQANAGNAEGDCLAALGLLGDISAVDTLLVYLTNEDLAESAALALNLITGAELYEDVFIPEEIAEDELFEEELEKLKKGEPLYPPGEEPGATINRLTQKPEDWQKWWAENRSNFNPGIRYRNGKSYSPACLLENLKSEKSPRRVRQLAYEELVIRYGIDFPFETDMFVAQQEKAIAQYSEWIKANSSRFRDGAWYVAGELMS